MAALWTVHGDGKHVLPTEVVSPDERLAWPQTIGLGMQHVLAMFGATFLVPVLIGFPPTTTIFFSGIGTICFILITLGRGQRLGLPSYLGSSFAFISPVILAEGHVGGNIPSALGGIFVCRRGLLRHRRGGQPVRQQGHRMADAAGCDRSRGCPHRPQPRPQRVQRTTPDAAPDRLSSLSQRSWCAPCCFAASSAGCRSCSGSSPDTSSRPGQGQYNFKPFEDAAWIGLPHFTTPTFSGTAILLIVPVVLVLIAENTGHIKAVASMTGRNLDRSLGRGYMGDGLATMLAGLGGGSGTTTYAENIGVMAATKVYSTAAYSVAGLFAICLGFIPEVRRPDLRPPGRSPRRGNDRPVRTDRRSGRPDLGGEPRRLQEPGEPHARRDRADHRRGELHAGPSPRATFAFNGIAIGSFTCIFVYQLMKYLARYGVFRDGEPGQPEPVASTPPLTGPVGGPAPRHTARQRRTRPGPRHDAGARLSGFRSVARTSQENIAPPAPSQRQRVDEGLVLLAQPGGDGKELVGSGESRMAAAQLIGRQTGQTF